jgi:hypothetical protein
MTFWDMLSHMFNGNETARAMRYSITVIGLMLIAGYFHLVSSEVIASVISLATGFIMGKSRNDSHYIPGVSRDRRHTDTIRAKEDDSC